MLRQGLRFSDGTPFSAADVVATLRRMMDPAVHSPMGDSFRVGEGPTIVVERPNQVAIQFPAPVAAVERLFDQIAISSAQSPNKERSVLGPFTVASMFLAITSC